MTPDQLQRMAKWLVRLEPDFFRINTGLGNFAFLCKEKMPNPSIIQIAANNQVFKVDQDRLFGACFRAAIARRLVHQFVWQTVQAPQGIGAVNIEEMPELVLKMESIDPRQYPVEFKTNYGHQEMGIAMATTLLRAHGVHDWESRDPEAKL
jgi:hypothetical protein